MYFILLQLMIKMSILPCSEHCNTCGMKVSTVSMRKEMSVDR